jgi:hypothetical protein
MRAIYPVRLLLRMSKEQLMGLGTISLGIAFSSAAFFELVTGQFMPGGYRNDVPWLLSSALLKLFREWGPYVSALIWLLLACVCFRVGRSLLREQAAWAPATR